MALLQIRVSLADIRERFNAYREAHSDWGSLHVALEDKNLRDADIRACISYAERKGDTEGAELGKILLQCTRTQRLVLSRGK